MDALANHRDQHGLDELADGYAIEFADTHERAMILGIELRANVLPFEGHGAFSSSGASLSRSEEVMQSLHAADGRIAVVVSCEFLEPFVLDWVARTVRNLSQRQVALGEQLLGTHK